MEWSVTAQSVGVRVHNGVDTLWPVSVAHARAGDADLTECGRTMDTWVTMWPLEFPVLGAPTCPVCLRAVAMARSTMALTGRAPLVAAGD